MTTESTPSIFISGQALQAWRAQQLNNLAHCQTAVTQSHSWEELSLELDWLLREVSGLDRLELRLGLFEKRSQIPCSHTLVQLDQLWHKRIEEGTPLQYLLGYTHWRTFDLKVSPAVLIPRPETEALIDIVNNVVAQHPQLQQGHWVDLGTGSGAIALGLADLLPQAMVHAVDLSAEALAIAQHNANTLDLHVRIQFYQGSWFEPLRHLAGKIQGICSNPPYIPTAVISTLQPEVQHHEPHLALDGGTDGLRDIRHLIAQAKQFLCVGGFLILECMAGQGEAIAQLMTDQNYQQVKVHSDLAGLDRFVQGFKP